MRLTLKPRILVYCTSAFLTISLSGCFPGVDLIGEYEKDVSSRKELWGGYNKGEKYILLHDIFLEEEEFPTKLRKYAGVAPRELTLMNYCLHYSAPDSIQAYLDGQESWPEVIGIVEAGTEIECTNVYGWGTLMWPMSHSVFAVIKNGPYAGKTIDMSDLSYMKSDSRDNVVEHPNFQLLKRSVAQQGKSQICDMPKVLGGYSLGQQFVLMHDVFLQTDDVPFENRLYAAITPVDLAEGNNCRAYISSLSIDEYRKSPHRWPNIIGIIDKGTKIQCTVLDNNLPLWRGYYGVYGQIKDGTYAGMLINMQDLSILRREEKKGWLAYPNNNLLSISQVPTRQ